MQSFPFVVLEPQPVIYTRCDKFTRRRYSGGGESTRKSGQPGDEALASSLKVTTKRCQSEAGSTRQHWTHHIMSKTRTTVGHLQPAGF
eukprot:1150039-Pelagomonas_calceolata.AAC.2